MIQRSLNPIQDEKRLGLRSEGEHRWSDGIVQRLDPQAIARQQQGLRPAIPYGEGKHAVQSLDTTFTQILIQMDDHFRIAPGLKRMAIRQQFLSDLLKVIDLSIKCDPYALIFVAERLMAGRPIDNA